MKNWVNSQQFFTVLVVVPTKILCYAKCVGIVDVILLQLKYLLKQREAK